MGAGAYLCWGFLPLYWRLFRGMDSTEILAQRIVWSLGLVFVLLAASRGLGKVRSGTEGASGSLPWRRFSSAPTGGSTSGV